jgi:hypothetical protein
MTLPEFRDVIWRLRDREALEREIALVCARSPYPKESAEGLFGLFWKHVQLHPLEWPSSERSPSEHTWRASGGISVRYRLIPDTQTVEILSVTGRHAHSDAR